MAAPARYPLSLLNIGDDDFQYGNLTLPDSLGDPVTKENVYDAIVLSSRAKVSRGNPTAEEQVSKQAMVACAQLEFALLHKSTAAAQAAEGTANDDEPRWFTNFRTQYNNDTANFRADMDNVKKQLATVTHFIAKLANHEGRVGNTGPFMEVPFENGTMPWGARVGNVTLLKLDCMQAIENLDGEILNAYFKGYFPHATLPTGRGARDQKRKAIARAIGHGA